MRIEDAELCPYRLPMKNTNRGNPRKKWGIVYPYHKWISTRWIERFIDKYLGKPYDKLYSDFINKIKSDKRCKSVFNEIMSNFLFYFDDIYHRHILYYKDVYGNVRKKVKKNDKIKYFKTIHKLNIDPKYYSLFLKYFNGEKLIQCLTGLTEKEIILFKENKNIDDFIKDYMDCLLCGKDKIFFNGFNVDNIFDKVNIELNSKSKMIQEIKECNDLSKKLERIRRKMIEETK